MTALALGATVAALVLAVAHPSPARVPHLPTGSMQRRSPRHAVDAALERWLPRLRDRRRDRQLPDALDRLASGLRSGLAVGPALVALAHEVPTPLGLELRDLARQVEHGASVADALAGWAAASHSSRDVRLVGAALTVGAGAGGEVARAVDGVAATLRERHEVLAEARALATQARASATLLVVAPLVFALLVATVDPRVLGFLLTTPVGAMCLVFGIGLDAAGGFWMARITRTAA